VDGDGRAGGASDGGKFKSAGSRASFHADQHGQPDMNTMESRTVDGGGKAEGASNENEFKSAGSRAFRHANQHG